MTDRVACLKFVHTDEERDWMCRCGHEAGDHGFTPSTTGGACLTCPAPDMVIPPAAIEAASDARCAHRAAPVTLGAVKCRCGQSFRTGVEHLQHASHAILTAAIPHLQGALMTDQTQPTGYELGNAVAKVVADHTGLKPEEIVELHITSDSIWVVYGVRTGPTPEDIRTRTRRIDAETGTLITDRDGRF
jgi:hypothetical protein